MEGRRGPYLLERLLSLSLAFTDVMQPNMAELAKSQNKVSEVIFNKQ